jgi:hypothetical protein
MLDSVRPKRLVAWFFFALGPREAIMARLKLIGAIPLAILAATLFAISPGPQGKAAGKPAAKAFPNGCVSCHVKAGASDRRLSVVVAKVKGHPNVSGMVKTVPKDCGICHKQGPKPPQLKAAVHKAHAKGFSVAAFGKKPVGACMNCHTADAKTGKVGIKSGSKNW